jgi:hypothetical protein
LSACSKAFGVGSPGTIRLGIINYLENELITLKVNLTASFPDKIRTEDQNLQEIIQIIPLDAAHTRIVSAMVGWGSGKDWDDAYHFFAKGNTWSYQQLLRYLTAYKQ